MEKGKLSPTKGGGRLGYGGVATNQGRTGLLKKKVRAKRKETI